jgi:hypothetical protein
MHWTLRSIVTIPEVEKLRGSPAGNGELRHVPRLLRNPGGFREDWVGEAAPGRAPLKKVFPDHWTFLLREAAMYSFVVLIVTGTFLGLFFQPA